MGENLVTIAEYTAVPQAELARGFLLEQGVLAILEGAQLATTFGEAQPWHGVRLRVRLADAERAGRALVEVEARLASLQAIRPEDRCLSCDTLLAPGASRCSACGWTWEHEIVS